MAVTIGVDVGGTTVAAAVVDEQGGKLATVGAADLARYRE
jgi:predicted NBD/HSP70 family sugar kinase